MKRLAVIPSDPMQAYWDAGYDKKWFEDYFNPCKYFDEVYILSPFEADNSSLVGTRAINTRPEDLPARLRQLKVDIIRAYGGYWACEMACRNRAFEVPVVVSVHNTDPRMYFDAVKRADFVWCAPQLVDFVMTKFQRRERIWELPNGIDFSVMRPYPKSETIDIDNKYKLRGKFRILQVGRRTRQKNLETLIRAVKLLGKEYSLLAVGRGKLEEYQHLAESEGVADQCVFIDSIDNTDMPRFFAWADCLVHPTRWEGMSLLIVEALASAAIVVVSDIPEMKGIVEHRQNGLLVKQYEDPHALADMIRIACTDESLRKELRKNARRSVEQFETMRVRKLEADHYAKVLQMKQNRQWRPQRLKEIAWKIEDFANNAALKSRVETAAKTILPSPIKRVVKRSIQKYREVRQS